MADDRQLREMTCDPKFRKVLVTDAKTRSDRLWSRRSWRRAPIWSGPATPNRGRRPPGFDRLSTIKQVALVPLDLTNSRAVKDLAGEIGGRVDILINTADHHRNFGIAARDGVETARAEMDMNYFGLLRLAQEFAPAMRARGADGQSSAVAWVNLLSVFALSNFPPHGPIRPRRRALSLAQCLRAELGPAGCASSTSFPAHRRRMEPGAAAAEDRAGPARRRYRRCLARRRGGCLSGRYRPGLAGALARQSEGARARACGAAE